MTKSLGFWRLWSIVVGGVIGSGIYLLPSVLAPYGVYSLVGWLIVTLGSLFIVLSLAALSRRITKMGGPYAYVREAFGDFPAFLVAYGYWISLWSAIAAIAVAFSGYLDPFFPIIKQVYNLDVVLAVLVVWVCAWINLRGVKITGAVQLVMTAIKILPLMLVGIGGLLLADLNNFSSPQPVNQPFPVMIASVSVLMMWAYVGIEVATVPADDIAEPEKTIPRVLIFAMLTISSVYLVAIVGVMALVPGDILAESSSPFSDAAVMILGSSAATFISVAVLLSIVGSLNTLVLIAGQMPLAAARDGLFPSQFTAKNKRGVPVVAILVSCALSSLFIVANYQDSLVSVFTSLILLSTLTAIAPYGACSAAYIWILLRDRKQQNRLGSVPAKALVTAILALAFSLFAIWGAGYKVLLYGLVLLTLGVPVYFGIVNRQRVTQ